MKNNLKIVLGLLFLMVAFKSQLLFAAEEENQNDLVLLEIPADQVTEEVMNSTLDIDDPAGPGRQILIDWSGVNVGLHFFNFSGLSVGSGLNIDNRAQLNFSGGYGGVYKYSGGIAKADLKIYPFSLNHRFTAVYLSGRYFHLFITGDADAQKAVNGLGKSMDVAQVNFGIDRTRNYYQHRRGVMAYAFFEVGVGEHFGTTPANYYFNGTFINLTIGYTIGGRWRDRPAARAR